MEPLVKTQKTRLGALLNRQKPTARTTLDRSVGQHDSEPRHEPVIPDSGDVDRAYAERVVDRDLALAEQAAHELQSVTKASSLLGANTVLVQTAGEAETPPIHKDALFIEQDRIPDGRCSSILESESAEIELTLADAVHQLDA